MFVISCRISRSLWLKHPVAFLFSSVSVSYCLLLNSTLHSVYVPIARVAGMNACSCLYALAVFVKLSIAGSHSSISFPFLLFKFILYHAKVVKKNENK